MVVKINITDNWILYLWQLSLGAGQPNPETFPYASMSVTLKSGETLTFDEDLFKRSLSYDLTVSEKNITPCFHL